MNKKQFLVGMILSSFMGGALVLGVYFMLDNSKGKTYKVVVPNQQVQLTNNAGLNSNVAFNFVAAAKKTTPAVVHIKTYVEAYQTSMGNDPFSQFFEEFYGYKRQRPNSSSPKQKQQREAGTGSGVILTDDGYIVTNNHVIDKAVKIEVTLNNKQVYEAELIGTDPTTDLALLKIEENDLSYVEFGSADNLQVGQWVVAVGNPFNLNSTVTAGIVSAKARNIGIINDKDKLGIETFIQTDAAVNPGNSGGALVNANGDLIGINSAIASPTGSFAGYSFAVPVELVAKVVADLKEYGEVQRALLGVSIQDVNPELSKDLKLNEVKGVYVNAVNANGAAADIGMQKDDVIIKVNDKEIDNTAELQGEIARHRPGDKVSITYVRKGELITKEVILRNKLGTTKVVKKGAEMIVELLGAKVKSLPTKLKEKYNIDGVFIEDVGNGAFADANIKDGFVITHIFSNSKYAVNSPAELSSIINASEGEDILVFGIYPESNKMARYAVSL